MAVTATRSGRRWSGVCTLAVSMQTTSVRQLRENLRGVLDRVRTGEEITILRRGKEIARLVPPRNSGDAFPDLGEHRAGIELRGERPGEMLGQMRDEAR